MKQVQSLGLFGVLTLVVLVVSATYVLLPVAAAELPTENTSVQSSSGQLGHSDSDSDSESEESDEDTVVAPEDGRA
jgi:hypothetical protein